MTASALVRDLDGATWSVATSARREAWTRLVIATRARHLLWPLVRHETRRLLQTERLRVLFRFCAYVRLEDPRCVLAGNELLEVHGYTERQLARICDIVEQT